MHIPDPYARTVRLFVTITNGRCKLHDGQELPNLKPETKAELVFSPLNIVEDKDRTRLMNQRCVLFLLAGTTLWARIKEDNIHPRLTRQRTTKKVFPGEPIVCVPFVLKQDLQLKIRAGKSAVLLDCECAIPAFQASAKSVNETYTRISVAFEPSRRSHTGNVFSCVYTERPDGLRPLNDLRIQKELETT
jgi:hypothetical protein